jgi:hypothetical protein
MVNKKHIIALDFIFVVGALLLIAGLVGYARPLVIAPIDDLTTTDGSVLFEFEKANLILLDDNLEFNSPQEIYAEDNLVINLKPGTYYWKVAGTLESTARKLTIQSEIELKIRDADDKYELVNSGNTRLNVDVYENDEFTESVILGVDEDKEVSGTKFVGREND